MIFMTKLCLVILGAILVIYIINVIFINNKKNKSPQTDNTSIKIPFVDFNIKLVNKLERECGAPNKPLRGDGISYTENIKTYKEIKVGETCPEKQIIKACK